MAARVKEFKDCTIVYQATGSGVATFTFIHKTKSTSTTYTENSLMTTTTGRQTVVIPLDGKEGEICQVKATPPSGMVLRLFKITLRYRIIGEYYDGAFGEYFDTKELDFGI
jgi:hypothetical protein